MRVAFLSGWVRQWVGGWALWWCFLGLLVLRGWCGCVLLRCTERETGEKFSGGGESRHINLTVLYLNTRRGGVDTRSQVREG